MSDRELRDALEQSQMRERATHAELQHALRTALDLQTRLANAERQVAQLQVHVDESAALRRLLTATMTTKVTPADVYPKLGISNAVMVAGLLMFLGLLWFSLTRG